MRDNNTHRAFARVIELQHYSTLFCCQIRLDHSRRSITISLEQSKCLRNDHGYIASLSLLSRTLSALSLPTHVAQPNHIPVHTTNARPPTACPKLGRPSSLCILLRPRHRAAQSRRVNMGRRPQCQDKAESRADRGTDHPRAHAPPRRATRVDERAGPHDPPRP
jgi:hypothetical protein